MREMDLDVKLAAAGDMEAFEKLYQLHHRRVYSICLRMTRNVSDAEDLTQDVFVQVFRKLKTFRGDAAFSTWLHRLAVNEVLMYFRKRAVRKEQTIAEDEDNQLAIVRDKRHSVTMPALERISLDEAIRTLSPGYRAVFILHDIGGYEHQQIANILGCAVGTSKSQLHKARFKLRQFLNQLRKITPEKKSLRLCETMGAHSDCE